MPEQIDDTYDFSHYGAVMTQILDGRTWRCQSPTDFQCKPANFAYQVRRAATRRGLSGVDVKVEDGGTVVVRARTS